MRFWNFIRNAEGERVLRLEGPIDSKAWWGDEVTPAAFRDELEAEDGDVTVWINSPGGDVFAAAEIYNILKSHRGKITVKIDALAASAASVIAMAGDVVQMSPVAVLMIHNPMTMAYGNEADLRETIRILQTVKQTIVNAYAIKTKKTDRAISKLMDGPNGDGTWMDAKLAKSYGFIDEILFSDTSEDEGTVLEGGVGNGYREARERARAEYESFLESQRKEFSDFRNRFRGDALPEKPDVEAEPVLADHGQTAVGPAIGLDGKTEDGAMPYDLLMRQLEFLK